MSNKPLSGLLFRERVLEEIIQTEEGYFQFCFPFMIFLNF